MIRGPYLHYSPPRAIIELLARKLNVGVHLLCKTGMTYNIR